MAPFDPFIRVVANMMQRFGGNGILEQYTPGEYNKETSTLDVEKKSYTVRAMMFDYIPRQDGQNTDKGTLIRTGDKQLFIKPSANVPAPKVGTDTVTFGGIKYSIVSVKELNTSGSTVVYYELYLRE